MTRHPTRRRLAPIACAALACGAAQAQTPAVLPQVEVVGATPLPGLGVPKNQVPSNVQTATAADLDRAHATDLSSFMSRRLGSVHINEVQNNPLQPDVNYRGFTASPLLGTPQGLSVYVDGVRLNQPFGDVVSWDLIPRAAIARIALMPGSNPLFGLNTLGGALSVTTKDGVTHPGSSVQLSAGSRGRAALEFEHGGSADGGVHWYVTGNRFHDSGWRAASPTDVSQLFGKLGYRSADTQLALSAALADNDLTGNGLQEQRLLAADRRSVYTAPDNTKNRALLLNLTWTQHLNDTLWLSGNAYVRRIRTHTLNGDVNDAALGQDLAAPGSGDARFPKIRCLAEAAANGEPAVYCSGVVNTTATSQRNHGVAGQLNWEREVGGRKNLFVAGAALDWSRVQFNQGSELGVINPDRSVSGVGAFGDGVSGGSLDGAPYDTRVDLSGRSRTWSLYATDTLALTPRTHLTVSGRYNRTTVTTADAITPGGGPGSLDGSNTYQRLNPAIGLTYSPSATLNAYAGYNEGSRAPSAIELGCADPANPCKLPNSFAGDPPLKQVVARTLEAGVRGGANGSFVWNLGLFRTDNSDDILFVADNASGFGYFKNFGKTRRQGLEAGVNARVGALTLGANYTWLDATYRSAEVVNGSNNSSNDQALAGAPGVDGTITIQPGNRIPSIPRHLLKLYADWDIATSWSLALEMNGVGSSYARGNENNQHQPDGVYYLGSGRSPAYAVFNLSADYRPTPAWKFYAQINNLFDRRYSTAAQLGATAFDANGNVVAQPFPANAAGDRPLLHSTFYAPGAPRSIVVGVKYSFGP